MEEKNYLATIYLNGNVVCNVYCNRMRFNGDGSIDLFIKERLVAYFSPGHSVVLGEVEELK